MLTRPKVTTGHRLDRLAIGTLALVLFACDGGGGVDDAMKKADEEPVVEKKPDDGKEREIPSSELPGPTKEELAAWDRKDPEGEKHLYKWDKANAKKMQTYWKELHCLRDKMKEEGQKAFGAEPGGAEQQQWEQFKLAFIDPIVDSWQQKLFAAEGQDILTKSKYISNIIEAHELVMNGYPVAFNDGDEIEIKRQDALWTVVENKVIDYSNKIGSPFAMPDLTDEKEKKKWDKFCQEVIFPKPKKGKK
jgi:hypothetical protein